MVAPIVARVFAWWLTINGPVGFRVVLGRANTGPFGVCLSMALPVSGWFWAGQRWWIWGGLGLGTGCSSIGRHCVVEQDGGSDI